MTDDLVAGVRVLDPTWIEGRSGFLTNMTDLGPHPVRLLGVRASLRSRETSTESVSLARATCEAS